MGKWEFTSKEQAMGQYLKNYQVSFRRFWLNHPNRSLSEGRPGRLHITYGTVKDEQPGEVFMLIRHREGGFQLNQLSRIFAKIGQC